MQSKNLNKILIRILHLRIKCDFASFVKMGFAELNSSSNYKHNWHIEEICKCLMKVEKSEISRVIINIPPRYLKSITISVCFVAWILGRQPEKKFITSSYSSKISIKHSLDTKKIMQSLWYKKIFPNTRIVKGQNEKAKFVTSKGGFRIATSSGGSLTGEGGDIIIVDDPHKPATIESKAQREKVIDWFESTLVSRLNDKKKGVIIIVMQRLHPFDLCGVLLSRENSFWHQIILKLVAEEDEKWRKKGEFLHTERDGAEEIEILKRDIGERQFKTQYQQSPPKVCGNLFKEEYICTTDFKKEADDIIVFSIDSASKVGISNDFTAITIWCIRPKHLILIDCKKIKLEFGALVSFIKSLILEYNPRFVLIEDKASGIPLLQEFRKFHFLCKIVAIKVKYDKVLRVLSCISLFEKRIVLINKSIPIFGEIKEEFLSFPASKNDDVIDATSHFLNWYQTEFNYKKQVPQIRSLLL